MSKLTLNESALKILIKQQIIRSSLTNLHELRGIRKALKFCDELLRLGINYELCIKHSEVKSCEESAIFYKRFEKYLTNDYCICKHLFLKERKGNKKFLIITSYQKSIDFKVLKELLDSRKLEFASTEDMNNCLNTTPGNVSIFNIINDSNQEIGLILDECLLSEELLAFHPLYNGMSVFIRPDEMQKFLQIIKHDSTTVNIPTKEKEKVYAKTPNDI